MAISSEQKALLFLAAVALLAAGVRASRARESAVRAGEQPGLAAQIQAADSARQARQSRGRASTDRPAADRARRAQPPTQPRERLDVDTASAESLMRLPGIGPAIAGRIIDERIANGPFGSLGALGTVKGIGPATLRRLDSLVTFSGPGRPPPPRADKPSERGRNRPRRVAGGR